MLALTKSKEKQYLDVFNDKNKVIHMHICILGGNFLLSFAFFVAANIFPDFEIKIKLTRI